MVRSDATSVPRIEQWLPFFEQSSEKRDADSWYECLEEELDKYKASVKLLVSDRAKALIKLGKPEYLNAFSSPDLFHFSQDISRSVGCKLYAQAAKVHKEQAKEGLSQAVKEQLAEQKAVKEENCANYTTHREAINQLVHPFDKEDQLIEPKAVETGLQQLFTKIRGIAQQADIPISLDKGRKIFNQIPDIAQGIATWQNWLREEVQLLDLPSDKERWVVNQVLPYAYWQVHLGKVSGRARDKELRIYYKQRAQRAEQNFQQAAFTNQLTPSEREEYVTWAFQMAATFHRASSQVEGRNGYLSFVHRAHKGIRPQRQEVLTVVHNYDIRRADGKTPAQRLFRRDFPPLFDFILENVTDFPAPRKRKAKSKSFK